MIPLTPMFAELLLVAYFVEPQPSKAQKRRARAHAEAFWDESQVQDLSARLQRATPSEPTPREK